MGGDANPLEQIPRETVDPSRSFPPASTSACPSWPTPFTGSALGDPNVTMELVRKFLLPVDKRLLMEQDIENQMADALESYIQGTLTSPSFSIMLYPTLALIESPLCN